MEANELLPWILIDVDACTIHTGNVTVILLISQLNFILGASCYS